MARTLLLVGLAGCGGLEPVAPYDEIVTDPAQLYMDLTLDYRALVLSTAPGYSTWQLTATPRNGLGEPMEGLPTPTFRSSDTTVVHVTAAGLLTARSAGTNVRIFVDVVAPGNLRHADTALVNVTALASPPTLDSISADPAPPDSAIRPINFDGSLAWTVGALTNPFGVFGPGPLAPGVSWKSLRPRAWDATGILIPQVPYEFVSLDPTVGNVATEFPDFSWQTVTWHQFHPGPVRFVARTTVYGVTKVDTVTFTITMPTYADVVVHQSGAASPGSSFGFPTPMSAAAPVALWPSTEVRIRPNGIVVWTNVLNHEVDVTFDDPTNVVALPASMCTAISFAFFPSFPDSCGAAGDFTIAAGPTSFLTVPTKMRQFPVPGVYTYRITGTATTGRIVVSDDPV